MDVVIEQLGGRAHGLGGKRGIILVDPCRLTLKVGGS